MIQIHQPSRSILLNAADPGTLNQVLPHSKLLSHPKFNIAVRHGLDEVRVLRNVGIKAPSPILYQYNWPGRFKPFKHQKQTSAFCTLHNRCFVLSEMGTAKTNSILWAADYLMSIGEVKRAIVVAPLSTLSLVWQQSIFNVLMHRSCAVLHGTREKRLKLLSMDFDFYIINHDALDIVAEEVKKRKDIDLMVVDEAADYRNSRTKRYEVFQELAKQAKRLWLVTGTPCPNEPSDAWAIARLINPATPKWFGTFKRDTMIQVSQYKWVPRPDAYEKVFAILQPGIRYKKSECIDLPPVMVEDRECDMSREQQDAFLEMKKFMAMQAANGEQVLAVNAADRINKLRQILCGAIKLPNNSYSTLDHAPRLKVLIECIEQASAKAIVVVPFKGIIQALATEIGKRFTVGLLNGDVSKTSRDRIVTAFKTSKDPHVLLCHPKVMSHGLDLTEADTTIFYAPIYSNDQSQQVMERFNRPGQTRNMTVVRIGSHFLEWDIYSLINRRKITQDHVLELYKRILED